MRRDGEDRERGKDEHLRRGEGDERYEDRDSELDDDSDVPVEPTPGGPRENPREDEVPPGTEPGAET